MTLDETQIVLTLIAGFFQGFHVPRNPQALAAFVGAWHEDVLGDLDYRAARRAVRAMARSGRDRSFTPNADEIRTAIVRASEPDPAPSLPDAWAEVVAQLRSTGYTGRPVWSHVWIDAAITAMGGWRAVCEMDLAVARAAFAAEYGHTNIVPIRPQLVAPFELPTAVGDDAVAPRDPERIKPAKEFLQEVIARQKLEASKRVEYQVCLGCHVRVAPLSDLTECTKGWPAAVCLAGALHPELVPEDDDQDVPW